LELYKNIKIYNKKDEKNVENIFFSMKKEQKICNDDFQIENNKDILFAELLKIDKTNWGNIRYKKKID
jgi:hypothetical protein